MLDFFDAGYNACDMGRARDCCPEDLTKEERRIWRDGWDTCKSNLEQQKENEKWLEISDSCPWKKRNGFCRATKEPCAKYDCAPLHFKEKEQL